jgi:hypothetical protein
MTDTRKQAQGFPVGEYLSDVLEERGWTTRCCAERMGGDVDVDELTLDLHIAAADCHESHPLHAIHDGTMHEETAQGLELALGISAECWMNLDRAYHEWRKQRKEQST